MAILDGQQVRTHHFYWHPILRHNAIGNQVWDMPIKVIMGYANKLWHITHLDLSGNRSPPNFDGSPPHFPIVGPTDIPHIVGKVMSSFFSGMSYLVGGLEHVFIFHFIYGMSSFPLTNSYFSRWAHCTTNQVIINHH